MTDLSTLSPEEKNVRLAELVGWKCINATGKYTVGMDPEVIAKGEPAVACVARVPDFTSSLDAVAAVEATLSDEQHGRFRAILWSITEPRADEGDWSNQRHNRAYVSALPTQRTEALIKTLEAK